MHKTHHSRTIFGSRDVEKVHAVEARSKFSSQNVKDTPGSEHVWKLRCWCEAHVQAKSVKTNCLGAFLDVQMSFCLARAGDSALVKSDQNVRVLQQFQLPPPIRYTTLRYTTLHYTTLQYTRLHSTTLQLPLQVQQLQLQLHYITLR